MKPVGINIQNYPALLSLYQENPKDFAKLLGSLLKLVDNLEEKGKVSKVEALLKQDFTEVVSQLLDGFLDVESMLKHHTDSELGGLLFSISGYNEHPYIQALVNEFPFTNANNEFISFKEKFGVDVDEFDLKGYLSRLIFFSWYCSLGDLATFLSGGNYKGLDKLQDESFIKKLAIQPALKYQADHGLLVGKLVEGTGYFDIGIPATEVRDYCLACKARQLANVPETPHKGCKRCLAGYKGE